MICDTRLFDRADADTIMFSESAFPSGSTTDFMYTLFGTDSTSRTITGDGGFTTVYETDGAGNVVGGKKTITFSFEVPLTTDDNYDYAILYFMRCIKQTDTQILTNFTTPFTAPYNTDIKVSYGNGGACKVTLTITKNIEL